MLALWLPVAVGAKVTLMAQLALAATLVQLLACVKLPFTAPTTLIALTSSGTVPVFVRVTASVWRWFRWRVQGRSTRWRRAKVPAIRPFPGARWKLCFH